MATDTSSDSQLPEFVELRLKPDALSRNQLPDIGFPVPGDQLPGLVLTDSLMAGLLQHSGS